MLQVYLCWLKVFLSTVNLRCHNFFLFSLTMDPGDPATFSFSMATKPTHRQYIYILFHELHADCRNTSRQKNKMSKTHLLHYLTWQLLVLRHHEYLFVLPDHYDLRSTHFLLAMWQTVQHTWYLRSETNVKKNPKNIEVIVMLKEILK